MKCKICGAELGIDEKICHECGNPIEEQNPSGTEENNQGEIGRASCRERV